MKDYRIYNKNLKLVKTTDNLEEAMTIMKQSKVLRIITNKDKVMLDANLPCSYNIGYRLTNPFIGRVTVY